MGDTFQCSTCRHYRLGDGGVSGMLARALQRQPCRALAQVAPDGRAAATTLVTMLPKLARTNDCPAYLARPRP